MIPLLALGLVVLLGLRAFHTIAVFAYDFPSVAWKAPGLFDFQIPFLSLHRESQALTKPSITWSLHSQLRALDRMDAHRNDRNTGEEREEEAMKVVNAKDRSQKQTQVLVLWSSTTAQKCIHVGVEDFRCSKWMELVFYR